MRDLPVILAKVTFLSQVNGGRVTMPALESGQYMPHLVVQPHAVRVVRTINHREIVDDYLGVRFLSGPTNVIRDEPCDCSMELMYHPNVKYDALHTGAPFTVREGGKIVGFGTVENSFEHSEE